MSQKDHARSVQSLFDAKAHAWSAKYAPGSRGGAPLAWRLDAFPRALAARCPPPARVLDFGCGTGDLANVLAERGYEVTAGDVSEAMLDQARAAFGARACWVPLDPTPPRMPFEDGAFDAVVASSVLEYLADVDAVLGEWARVLRPSGILVASVPDASHPVRRLEKAAARLLVRRNDCRAGARTESWLARLSSRAANYVEYLRLSKNRYSHQDWVAKAESHGFLSFVPENVAAEPTLEVLGFYRP